MIYPRDNVYGVTGRWHHPIVIPLAFDKSISQYERISNLLKWLRDLQKALDEIETNFKNYTDQEIEKLKKYVDAQDKILQDQIDALNKDLEDLEKYIDDKFIEFKLYIDQKLKDFQESFNKQFEAIRELIKAMNDENWDKL